MVLLYPSFPAISSVDRRNRRTEGVKVYWSIGEKPRKVPFHGSTFFGGTVLENDTNTGVMKVVGSPNSLEGIHHYLKPGMGSQAYTVTGDASGGHYIERIGELTLPWNFIQRAFIIIDNPTHPGERPTTAQQAHPPKFLLKVRLDRR